MRSTAPDDARIDRLVAALRATWPADELDAGQTAAVVRAPGRINLMGDHADYNDGYVLPAAIDLETWVALRPRSDDQVRIASRQLESTGLFRLDELSSDRTARDPSRGPAWPDYVAGTAWSLGEAALPIRGFDGLVHSTIPIGVGLGSSAALELAAAVALLSPDTVVNPRALAAIAQRAEREFVGVSGGIVDQYASAAGREGRALLLDCRSLETSHVKLPFGLQVVVCDTGSPTDRNSPVFAERQAECCRAVALLSERMPGLGSLRDLDRASLARHRTRLPEVAARRAEHVVTENGRVLATVRALEFADLDELGRLFAESHASLRDRYSVGAPALDVMVELAVSTPGVVAARATGPGLGGCTVNLVLEEAVPRFAAMVEKSYRARTGLEGKVYPVRLVDGAGPVTSRF